MTAKEKAIKMFCGSISCRKRCNDVKDCGLSNSFDFAVREAKKEERERIQGLLQNSLTDYTNHKGLTLKNLTMMRKMINENLGEKK